MFNIVFSYLYLKVLLLVLFLLMSHFLNTYNLPIKITNYLNFGVMNTYRYTSDFYLLFWDDLFNFIDSNFVNNYIKFKFVFLTL